MLSRCSTKPSLFVPFTTFGVFAISADKIWKTIMETQWKSYHYSELRSISWKNISVYSLTYFELSVNPIKSSGIFRQLFPNIFRAHEDTLQMCPSPLNFKPHCDHLICYRQFLLPAWYLFQEIRYEFRCYQVLQLHLQQFTILWNVFLPKHEFQKILFHQILPDFLLESQ